MNFSKKIIVSILFLHIISSAVFMYLGHYQYVTVLDMTIQKKERDTVYLVNSIFDEIKNEYTSIGREILTNKDVITAFANKDRRKLLSLTLPIYKKLKEENKDLYVMHFHTVDTHSYLRVHKPKKFGDNLSLLRPIIVKTNKYKKMQQGLEVGKFGIYYRITFPVFQGEKHIGAFEFGIDIKYLMSKFSTLNMFKPILVVTKKAVEPIYKYDKNANKYLNQFTKNYSLVNYESRIKNKVPTIDIMDKQIIADSYYMKSLNNKKYLVFKSLPVKDYKNSSIGYFVFIDEIDYYMDTIVFIRYVSLITTFILVLIIVALIFKLIINYTSELHKQKDILKHQAHHDMLTGLPNRILFNDRLKQTIKKAKRDKEDVALLFIDLDRFKHINDSLGHLIGDKVLQVISDRLKNIIRDEDTVARLGGDEFTVILQGLKKETDASLLAQKIIRSMARPMSVDNHTLYITSSIGISIYPEDAKEVNNLIKYADTAMYKAKEEGRNNFQYYSSDMTDLAFERVVMETSLRVALENNQFVVYFQPQVDAKNNKIIGMEALVRWQHPTMGLLFPDKFIPLAEDTGLIIQLDRWVMKQAMKQIVKWNKQGINTGVLALNLAMRQLQEEDFIHVFRKMISVTGCKPEWLELEVTEGEIMKNPENAIEVLSSISDMGVELAIDDFGTGYSSLSYLKRLPVSKLKIDQSFTRGLPDDKDDAAIVKTIISLAKNLSLKLIAEGVETEEQKEFMLENGCSEIQGYLYSKPMSSEETKKFIASYQ